MCMKGGQSQALTGSHGTSRSAVTSTSSLTLRLLLQWAVGHGAAMLMASGSMEPGMLISVLESELLDNLARRFRRVTEPCPVREQGVVSSFALSLPF